MDKNNIIEIIRGGKVIKTVNGFDALDDAIDPILEEFRNNKNWDEISGEYSSNYGFNVFLNKNNLSTETIAWRSRYDFKDSAGNYVYHDTMLTSNYGVKVWLREHPYSDKWLYVEDIRGSRNDITPKIIAQKYTMDRSSVMFNEIIS
ncbi:hypothetical protein [uncultured Methanobrevibacter sp.]|uniref:hypothetical protein n=1 Tax=uncultured Methanobrevibacter sp. TaxID=253161 RepID=UPI0025F84DF4|nr:hypothetical protein [uncultured Methanobrevibacter sp.]